MKVVIKKSDVIKFFGSQSKAGRALGITRQAVWKWGIYVPDPSASHLALKYPAIKHTIEED